MPRKTAPEDNQTDHLTDEYIQPILSTDVRFVEAKIAVNKTLLNPHNHNHDRPGPNSKGILVWI